MLPVFLNFALVLGIMMVLKFLPRPLQRLKFRWRRLGGNVPLSLLLAAVIPVLIHLVFYPRPEPSIQDEFSYLLQADTFAHGRLANSTPPFWPHFEQVHVLAQPTFSSKYPLLQGAFLAAGEKLGDPYCGVLLSSALMFAALLWMFYGWLPPSYALLGWVVALTKLGPSTYWMNSYWGGSAAALSGALVLGAWPRLAGFGTDWSRKVGFERSHHDSTARNGILFGLGIVLLAVSRPYEGLLICAPASLSLLWLTRQQRPKQHWLVWASPVVSAGLVFLAYYNYRVTGNALSLPYVLHQQQYEVAGYFVFTPQKTVLPVYHNEIYRIFWTVWVPNFVRHCQQHPWEALIEKMRVLWVFFCRDWPLSLSLLGLPFLWRNRRMRWATILFAPFLAGVSLLVVAYPHYVAPAAGLIIVLMIGGLHRIRLWNPQGKPTGSLLARVAIAATVFLFARDVIYRDVIQKIPMDMAGSPELKANRRRLTEQLKKIPGQHLVLVRYLPSHDPDFDYVVNGADLENQNILWARELDPASDEKLMQHFRQRHIWKMNGDLPAPQLEPVTANAITAMK